MTSRSPRSSRRFLATMTVAMSLALTACTSAETAEPTTLIEGAAVTLAADASNGFLWATRDGSVYDDSGALVAALAVETDGQRGLLGLTVDDDGRIFVAYTDVTFDLVVSELGFTDDTSSERVVWRGPKTVQGGNGGRMIALGGELVIGIGLLNDRDGQADPESVVGKLIAIEPDLDPADQTPRVLSGPWNNPFAFGATPAGELWVADNHPSDGDERVARGDQGIDPMVALVLPPDSAPSGLAATDDAIFICSYNTLELQRYDLVDGTLTFAETLAEDCLLDVERLSDGRLIYSTGSAIVRLDP